MKTAARPPLRRLAALDRMVRAGSYPNASSAALELEVHPRTIHRDLTFLRDDWGAPLAFSHEKNGYYYRECDYTLPWLRLTEGELLALFLAERLLQQYQDSPFAPDLARLFQKLSAALPAEVTVDLSHLGAAFSLRAPPARMPEAKRFRQLERAVCLGRQLDLTYWTASRDETCRRVVDPYHLVSAQGDWYLVGYCHLREEVRMFVPGRIRSLRETGAAVVRPAGFDIADYLDATFQVVRGRGKPLRIRLRFAPEAARYVREKVWHSSQRLVEQKDGGVILTLKVAHLLEVRRWALSWGGACEVLEPAALREEMRREVEHLAQFYGRRE